MRRTPLNRNRTKPRRKGPKFKSGIERAPKRRWPEHRTWLASLPCGICGSHDRVVGAHLRLHTDGGGSLKPSDWWEWPGCYECHIAIQHQKGEPYFFTLYAVDPWRLCLEYARQSPVEFVRFAAEQFMLPHIEQLEAA